VKRTRRPAREALRKAARHLARARTGPEVRAAAHSLAALALQETDAAVEVCRLLLGEGDLPTRLGRLLPTKKDPALAKAVVQRAGRTGVSPSTIKREAALAALHLVPVPPFIREAGAVHTAAWLIRQALRIAKADLLDEPQPEMPSSWIDERRRADALDNATSSAALHEVAALAEGPEASLLETVAERRWNTVLGHVPPAERVYLAHLAEHPGLSDPERDEELRKRPGYSRQLRTRLLHRVANL